MTHVVKVSDEDKDTSDLNEKKLYYFYETSVVAKTTHFYISDGVEDPSNYVDMIHRIRTASQHDTIYIHLNTPGGRLDTGVQIINAMRASQARIVTVLEAEAHSLGTLIFLAGDEFIVQDNCLMMFHNFSSGTWGKGNEQHAQLEATLKWFEKLTTEIYVPFMTKAELDKILNGQDLWMDSEEIGRRLRNMVKILQQEEDQKITKKKTTKKKATKKS